jgi:hypothetical protein
MHCIALQVQKAISSSASVCAQTCHRSLAMVLEKCKHHRCMHADLYHMSLCGVSQVAHSCSALAAVVCPELVRSMTAVVAGRSSEGVHLWSHTVARPTTLQLTHTVQLSSGSSSKQRSLLCVARGRIAVAFDTDGGLVACRYASL